MELIKAAHGSDGSFKNVNASKENWINGAMGISGFYITCVANMNTASVQITLSKWETAANKAAFDFLFARKAEIESALGIQLKWYRMDDKKSSYVVLDKDGVGTYDETSWTQMAEFHAEWSKKFYNIFVQLLQQGDATR